MSDRLPSPRTILEQAIAHNFDDRLNHQAYADLLLEDGDPRGEYIHLRLAFERDDLPQSERKRLNALASSLYQRYERTWLGDLADLFVPERHGPVEPVAPNLDFTCQLGWLTELEVFEVTPTIIERLAAATAALCLQRLTLLEGAAEEVHLEPLANARALRQLRHLQVGSADEDDPMITRWTGLVSLIGRQPLLESLTLRVGDLDAAGLFGLPMSQLKRLAVASPAHFPLNVLGRNLALTRLEVLSLIHAAAPAWGWDDEVIEEALPALPILTSEELRQFFGSTLLTQLRTLQLCLPYEGDRIARVLRETGLWPNLRVLDLSYTGLTDEGARHLSRVAGIRNLEQLVLHGNPYLSDAAAEVLNRLNIPVLLSPSDMDPEADREAGEDDFYGQGVVGSD